MMGLIIGIIFVSLIFFTFETLLILGLIYLSFVPVSALIYLRYKKKFKEKNIEEDHEDIL